MAAVAAGAAGAAELDATGPSWHREADEVRAGAAAAAAHALREDARSRCCRCVAMLPAWFDVNFAAVAARARVAADGEVERGGFGFVVADVVVGVAAAAAHRLRQQADAAIALREDVAAVLHVDQLAVARRAAAATHADVDGATVVIAFA